MSQAAWRRLRKSVIECQACPRLVEHTRNVAKTKRKSYRDQKLLGRPCLIWWTQSTSAGRGSGPGGAGANRTGRMFTGDRSGDWLYRAMHRTGFSSQEISRHRRDGLTLIDAAITNVGRCAPPGINPPPGNSTPARRSFGKPWNWSTRW